MCARTVVGTQLHREAVPRVTQQVAHTRHGPVRWAATAGHVAVDQARHAGTAGPGGWGGRGRRG